MAASAGDPDGRFLWWWRVNHTCGHTQTRGNRRQLALADDHEDFFIAKLFRAQGANILRQEKNIRDHGDAGVPGITRGGFTSSGS
jgi:hypothetical protein